MYYSSCLVLSYLLKTTYCVIKLCVRMLCVRSIYGSISHSTYVTNEAEKIRSQIPRNLQNDEQAESCVSNFENCLFDKYSRKRKYSLKKIVCKNQTSCKFYENILSNKSKFFKNVTSKLLKLVYFKKSKMLASDTRKQGARVLFCKKE